MRGTLVQLKALDRGYNIFPKFILEIHKIYYDFCQKKGQASDLQSKVDDFIWYTATDGQAGKPITRCMNTHKTLTAFITLF